MDYSAITQELIEKRFDVLPEKVRETLDSEKNREETQKICSANFLNEEQSLIVEQITSLILLGFANPKELQTELIINAGLTDENAAKIAAALKEKILSQAGNDLGRVYSPLTEPTISEIKTEAVKEGLAVRMPLDAIAPSMPAKSAAASTTPTEPAPFVLYEDKQKNQPAEIRKPLNRPFSFSFGIFKPQNAAAPRNEVQAQIETMPTGRQATDGGQEKEEAKAVKMTLPGRTVHYSEFRSPVSPFGGNSITNLEKPVDQLKPAVAESPSLISSQPTPPPVNDSVIDLRNL